MRRIRPKAIIALAGAIFFAVGLWMEIASPVDLGSMIDVGLGPATIIEAHRGLLLAAFGAVLLVAGLWRTRRRRKVLNLN
jgi:hypothetical protein